MVFIKHFSKIIKEETNINNDYINSKKHEELDNIFCVLDEEVKKNIINKMDKIYYQDINFLYKNYPNLMYYIIKSSDKEYIQNNLNNIITKSCLYKNIEIIKYVFNTLKIEDFKNIIEKKIINVCIIGGSVEILDFLLSLNTKLILPVDSKKYLNNFLIGYVLYLKKFDIFHYLIKKYYNNDFIGKNFSDSNFNYMNHYYPIWIYKWLDRKKKDYKILKEKNISIKEYIQKDFGELIIQIMMSTRLGLEESNKSSTKKIEINEDIFCLIYCYMSEEWINQHLDKLNLDKQIYLKLIYSYKFYINSKFFENYKYNLYHSNLFGILTFLTNNNYFKHLPVFKEWNLINNKKKQKKYEDTFSKFIEDIKYITPKSKLSYEFLMNKDVLNFLLNNHFEELRINGFLNSILDYIFMSNSLSLINDLSDFITPRTNFYLFAIDKIGTIESLQYLLDINTPKHKNICEYASINGKKDILEFLHKNDFPWDELTPNAACINNHFDCLEYALNNGCKWSSQSWYYIHENMNKYFKTKNTFLHSLKQIKQDDTVNLDLAKEYNKKLDIEYEQLIKTINFIKNYEKENNIETPVFSIQQDEIINDNKTNNNS